MFLEEIEFISAQPKGFAQAVSRPLLFWKMAVHRQSFSLDQPCTDAHLSQISEWIPDWRVMAPFLGLRQQDALGYVPQDSGSPAQTGMAMLNLWKETHGQAASYNRLAEAFRQCDRYDLADRVSELHTQVADRRSSIGEKIVVCWTSLQK